MKHQLSDKRLLNNSKWNKKKNNKPYHVQIVVLKNMAVRIIKHVRVTFNKSNTKIKEKLNLFYDINGKKVFFFSIYNPKSYDEIMLSKGLNKYEKRSTGEVCHAINIKNAERKLSTSKYNIKLI